MISALCDSPRRMRAVTQWRDALVEEQILLRDIIDLDATFGGPPEPPPGNGANGAGAPPAEWKKDGHEPGAEDEDDDGLSEETSLYLALMKGQHRAKVMEILDVVEASDQHSQE